jgi:HNH endonuclease
MNFLHMRGKRRPLLERFTSMYIPVTESGCWIWMGSCKSNGYGTIGLANRKMGHAHRVSYELHNGPIAPGQCIDHLCRVRCCVNPDHLEAVTTRVNLLRGHGETGNNARKTHCPQGHIYDSSNTYHWTDGRGRTMRQCKICRHHSDSVRIRH